jgi:hypothetical protein
LLVIAPDLLVAAAFACATNARRATKSSCNVGDGFGFDHLRSWETYPMKLNFFATTTFAGLALVAAIGSAQAASTELVCKVTATSSASNLGRGPQEEPVGDWVFLLDTENERLTWKSGEQLRAGVRGAAPFTVDHLDIGPDSIRFCAWPGGCDQPAPASVGAGTARASVITIDRTSGALSMTVEEDLSFAVLHFDYHGTCNKAPPKPKPKF